jgi:hypothetical protein
MLEEQAHYMRPHETVTGPMSKRSFFVLEDLSGGPFRFSTFNVAFIGKDLRLVRVSKDEITDYSSAALLRDVWGRLDLETLRHALWLLQSRYAYISPHDIPMEASHWVSLGTEARQILWRLFESGAPGSVTEVDIAARKCGLY